MISLEQALLATGKRLRQVLEVLRVMPSTPEQAYRLLLLPWSCIVSVAIGQRPGAVLLAILGQRRQLMIVWVIALALVLMATRVTSQWLSVQARMVRTASEQATHLERESLAMTLRRVQEMTLETMAGLQAGMAAEPPI